MKIAKYEIKTLKKTADIHTFWNDVPKNMLPEEWSPRVNPWSLENTCLSILRSRLLRTPSAKAYGVGRGRAPSATPWLSASPGGDIRHSKSPSIHQRARLVDEPLGHELEVEWLKSNRSWSYAKADKIQILTKSA